MPRTLLLTPPMRPLQVCFIGRSNVGKSSLVNMLCNRKALAYTSKTPGKTKQFNFFTVNDKVRVRVGEAERRA